MYEAKFGEWVAKIGRLHGSFVHLPVENIPWAPLKRPLAQSRMALVTTGGVHRRDQAPFDEWNEDGEWTFREIPDDTPSDALMISHVHYAHADADRDINCVFPLDRLHELQAHLRFPMGNPLGEPFEVAFQRQIVRDTLGVLATAEVPRTIVPLPYRWRRKPEDR